MNRREVFQKLSGAIAVAGGTALIANKKAFAQDCQVLQRADATNTYNLYNPCTQQNVRVTVHFKNSLTRCTSQYGDTFQFREHAHGTGESYDPSTGLATGTEYVFKERDRVHTVEEYAQFSGCSSGTFSTTQKSRELLINKSGGPDERLVYSSTEGIDEACHYFVTHNMDTDCSS